jgi:xylulose-5-phosphate/fructose-6-phosphate phosphoketolase
MVDKRIAAREYTREHGDDIPEVLDWAWPGAGDAGAGAASVAATLSTGGDNE